MVAHIRRSSNAPLGAPPSRMQLPSSDPLNARYRWVLFAAAPYAVARRARPLCCRRGSRCHCLPHRRGRLPTSTCSRSTFSSRALTRSRRGHRLQAFHHLPNMRVVVRAAELEGKALGGDLPAAAASNGKRRVAKTGSRMR